ncbi:MAG: right-handed parallel beta-helix repeat-containing protein [Spirochaetaceae bacterium]|nr:right-handed parallel beta-helix repeat-containing protein [Spirochaetaceae bacterium]
MKKKGFVWGTLIVGMAFGFMLAGCASTGGSQDSAKAAGRLAADINAIEAGKAAVNGVTVTLTGWAGLNTALTVPTGVTLDVTAEGAALELRDGAVLTVDGTVNATGHGDHGKGWIEGSLRVGDGKAVIAGSGTINIKSKGRLLNIGSDRALRQLTLDGVTLVGLKDNDASLVEVHNGGAFVMKSGAVTGNTRFSDDWADGGGVALWKGTFVMEGGEISGNSASGKRGASGGGVQIGEVSVFTMTGGTISGNTAQGSEGASGGGVRIGEGAVFTITGGAISGNTAQCGNGIGGGGGVSIDEEAVFTMEGGAITSNSAQSGRGNGSSHGGGVRIAVGIFTMKGGEISGNTGGDGGGMMVDRSTFTMEDGAISGNTAGNRGGGVSVVNRSTFTMEGGTISGNSANGSEGGGVSQLEGTFTMKGGTLSGNSAGGVRFGDNCKFIMEGGTISGNTGSGVIFRNNPNWRENDAMFTMKGGRIQGNADSDGFAKNTGTNAALDVGKGSAQWGTGGAYTKGGVSQTSGSDIGSTDDTLIAIPAQ